ncbi:MAG: hypothetical protein A2W91_12300 [Bacteroidetes bacterium GWF2_38_335]|nr:MAG: hypothetical protein A2W91_12300 [Bacteroidetes bacterium GWF2_38_335]OFY76950.1 MAG: hypothetical protein A2281_00415 [Bacteroidetes bacterium RIFOXYA12_FULL_38_20]HBS86804.1 hypothetical protein [Bacteroidales bacterium]
MKQTLFKLDWDSEFFQYNVCRINGLINSIEDLKAIDLKMKESKFKLAYYSSSDEISFDTIDFIDIFLVDKKTTFLKPIDSNIKSHPAICSYDSEIPSIKLIKLAFQSGVYSRFNIDKKIGRKKFEELYSIWITKSVKREIAKEVIVYKKNDDIAGYLTIGEKNNRADLGMGAVDPKYRGLNIGKVLFENAEKWAFDNGYKYIQIVTQGDNIPACKLYEKLGYTAITKEYFYHIWKK